MLDGGIGESSSDAEKDAAFDACLPTRVCSADDSAEAVRAEEAGEDPTFSDGCLVCLVVGGVTETSSGADIEAAFMACRPTPPTAPKCNFRLLLEVVNAAVDAGDISAIANHPLYSDCHGVAQRIAEEVERAEACASSAEDGGAEGRRRQ